MTTLSSGVLLKLLDGMKKTGAAKPVGEHGTAVLQVTDIVPAELDEKGFFPNHGKFYLKVSDASHSIYATLPLAQADLVSSNKLRIGQFIHVDRLDQASPVPVIVGAKLLLGRHPFAVDTPDTAARSKQAAPCRRSWDASIKLTTLNFDAEKTQAKDRTSAATPVRERSVAAWPPKSTASVRKSSSVLPSMLTRSKSFVADRDHQPKIPKSPFPKEKSSVSCTASRAMRRLAKEEEPSLPPSSDGLRSSATSSKKRPLTATRVPLSGNLSLLGKDAIEKNEHAQKAADEAVRNATATKYVVSIYKKFSELSKAARPDTPASTFDSFPSFDQEAVLVVQAIEAMAATVSSDEHPQDVPPVLQEISKNREVVRRRGIGGSGVSKSVSFAPGTFMEFLEVALETGLKKSKVSAMGGSRKKRSCCCPQELMMRVSNWVETEQSGGSNSSRRTADPREKNIARKLRIMVKNPL